MKENKKEKWNSRKDCLRKDLLREIRNDVVKEKVEEA